LAQNLWALDLMLKSLGKRTHCIKKYKTLPDQILTHLSLPAYTTCTIITAISATIATVTGVVRRQAISVLTRFLRTQNTPKSKSSGSPPQTPLGELTALPPDALADEGGG